VARNFVALVCLALAGGSVSADEPPDIYTDTVRVEENVKAALDLLKGSRRKYEFVRTAIAERRDGGDLNPAQVRLADCEADLVKARTTLRRAVVHSRTLALRHAVAGHPEVVSEYYTKVAESLQQLIGDKDAANSPVAQALTAINNLRDWLEKPTTTAPKAEREIADALTKAEERAGVLASDLEGGNKMERLKKTLLAIREEQTRIRRDVNELYLDHTPSPRRDSRYPYIAPHTEVVVGKGDRISLRHAIEWRQFDADELEVKVTSSDPSLTIPATLKLDFEKHQFRFEYEVKAGEKAGEFTITLTPAAGKPVTVKVTVK
jgi:hypothetical protein